MYKTHSDFTVSFCFVNCVEFPTSSAELGVVFSLFDSHKLGRISYKEFVDTVMRPDRQVLFLSCLQEEDSCFHAVVCLSVFLC